MTMAKSYPTLKALQMNWLKPSLKIPAMKITIKHFQTSKPNLPPSTMTMVQ